MNATSQVIENMNRWGKEKKAFFFLFDYLCRQPEAWLLPDIDPEELRFNFNGIGNYPIQKETMPEKIEFEAIPLNPASYHQKFDKVMYHLRRGDSYLLNLTQTVQLHTNLSLKQIYDHSWAPYKLWFRDQFTFFSPEPFVRIENGLIHTHPMKGTIKADVPEAESLLMQNRKELAEHYTIVDLLRNDMGIVADHVEVLRFRYPELIHTSRGKLLQTSSHIRGKLNKFYAENLGQLIFALLPAGSISGAPKKKTCAIIAETEGYERGYYTGICGLFDGQKLDSSVMIRYVEKTPDGLIFKAGGGITVNSNVEHEYDELMQKVYLPIKP